MLYRFTCYDKNEKLVYALETTCFYTARGHYWGAEVNPQIASVSLSVDHYDGKGWQHLGSRTIT